jgi:hypothetical protein
MTLSDLAFAPVCFVGINGSIFLPARPRIGLPSLPATVSAAAWRSSPVSITVDFSQPSVCTRAASAWLSGSIAIGAQSGCMHSPYTTLHRIVEVPPRMHEWETSKFVRIAGWRNLTLKIVSVMRVVLVKNRGYFLGFSSYA